MDIDELLPKRPADPLTEVCREDLDRLSVVELEARIEALRGEIARVEAKLDGAVSHRKAAEQIFKR